MLTKKQELTVQYVVDGMNKTEAVQKAFNCSSTGSASSIAYKLFKQPEVQNRLTDKKALLDNKTVDDYIDFQHQAKANIPPQNALDKITTLMNCGDKRVELQATDMYLKIIGGYKDKDNKLVGLFASLREKNQ